MVDPEELARIRRQRTDLVTLLLRLYGATGLSEDDGIKNVRGRVWDYIEREKLMDERSVFRCNPPKYK